MTVGQLWCHNTLFSDNNGSEVQCTIPLPSALFPQQTVSSHCEDSGRPMLLVVCGCHGGIYPQMRTGEEGLESPNAGQLLRFSSFLYRH